MNFKKWLEKFELEAIPNAAIDELVNIVEVAEEKSKIALVDLLRLLLVQDDTTYHILKHHWETFDVSIIQYLQCMDIKDPDLKVIHNYHLVSLKMFGNIYQTPSGLDFIQDNDHSNSLLKFCEFSLTSKNPKTVFTASVVIFNHVLTYKRDFKNINQALGNILMAITENLDLITDAEALNAILLAETRILYRNQEMVTKAIQMKDKFVKVHKDVQSKSQDNGVKQAIEDVLSLIGE